MLEHDHPNLVAPFSSHEGADQQLWLSRRVRDDDQCWSTRAAVVIRGRLGQRRRPVPLFGAERSSEATWAGAAGSSQLLCACSYSGFCKELLRLPTFDPDDASSAAVGGRCVAGVALGPCVLLCHY